MSDSITTRELQQQLLRAGFSLPRFGADNIMGAETRAAIRAAETQFGLPVDGVVDDALVAALASAAEETRIERIAALAPAAMNDRGDNVRLLQQGLVDAGFNPGRVDGIYGNRTRDAVIAFQRDRGLEETGELDDVTLSALRTSTVAVAAAEPEIAEAEVMVGGEIEAASPEVAAVAAEPVVEAAVEASAAVALAADDTAVEASPFLGTSPFPSRNSEGVFSEGREHADIGLFKQGLMALNYLSQADYERWPDRLDDVTRQALRDFQEDYDIQPDGLLGDESWTAMTEALAVPPMERLFAGTPVEFRGSVGVEPQAPMLERSLTQAEIQLLTRLVFDEAGNQTQFGQQAVVENVINRMLSADFPDTIRGVIYDRAGGVQYSPILGDGLTPFASIPSGFRERTAAMIEQVVEGVRPQITGGAEFFANMDLISFTKQRWFERQGSPIQIGDHTFFGGDPVVARSNLDQLLRMETPVILAAGDPIMLPRPRPDIESEAALLEAVEALPETIYSWVENAQSVLATTLAEQQEDGLPNVPGVRPTPTGGHNL